MHPLKLQSLVILLLVGSANLTAAAPAASTSKHTSNNAQFVHEKDTEIKAEPTNSDDSDQYHLTNDYKSDVPQQPYSQWSAYPVNDFPQAAARFMSMFGYPNPIYIPYPVYVPQEVAPAAAAYPSPYQDYEDYEEAMARSGTRRGASYRNSPIYYVRLPPTPYMFIPGLGYHSQPPTFTPSFSPLLSYNPVQALPVQPAINPFINLPMNFLSNAKPTGIYQLDSNAIQAQQFQQAAQYQPAQYQPAQYQPAPHQFNPFVPAPQPPPRPYRPQFAPSPSNYVPSESKISQMKRPFLFNGRPEQIYLLPAGGFNPMYQSPISGYY